MILLGIQQKKNRENSNIEKFCLGLSLQKREFFVPVKNANIYFFSVKIAVEARSVSTKKSHKRVMELISRKKTSRTILHYVPLSL